MALHTFPPLFFSKTSIPIWLVDLRQTEERHRSDANEGHLLVHVCALRVRTHSDTHTWFNERPFASERGRPSVCDGNA